MGVGGSSTGRSVRASLAIKSARVFASSLPAARAKVRGQNDTRIWLAYQLEGERLTVAFFALERFSSSSSSCLSGQVLVERSAPVSDKTDLDLLGARIWSVSPFVTNDCVQDGTHLATGELEVVHLLDRSHRILMPLEPAHGESRSLSVPAGL